MERKKIGLLLRRRRLQLGLVQRDIAEAIGVKSSYITRIENGDANFTIDKLLEIAKVLNVPEYEIFTERHLIPYESQEPQLNFNQPGGDYVGVKLFQNPVSLGPGYELSDMPPDDYAPILKNMLPKGYKSDPDRIVAFHAKGSSMKPTINDGSIVWIDRLDVIPKEGEVYAFLLKDFNNAVTIKRLLKIDRHNMIIDGDNHSPEDRKDENLKDYPMALNLLEYTAEDVSPVRGRVIWVLNRLIERPKKK